WTFCAATAMSVPASNCTAVASDTNGGHTTTSMPETSARRNSRQNAAVSAGPLNIFQFPAISTGRSYEDSRAVPRATFPPWRRDTAPAPAVVEAGELRRRLRDDRVRVRGRRTVVLACDQTDARGAASGRGAADQVHPAEQGSDREDGAVGRRCGARGPRDRAR